MLLSPNVLLLLLATIMVAAAQNLSFSGPQGIIYSPGYPDNYSNQLNQYYTISVDPGYYIYLTLFDFATEACCDKLFIWDGDDTTAPTIANVSGDATGQIFSSSGSLMTLLFNTDVTGEGRGFAIQHEMVPVDTEPPESNKCESGFHSGLIGFITSPDWPSAYPNDITCYYLLTAPQERRRNRCPTHSLECDVEGISRVMLTFVAFSVEDCCDKVEIYDGPNITSPKLATLSGSALVNTTYYSSEQNMFLTFFSDFAHNEQGFSAYYMQVT